MTTIPFPAGLQWVPVPQSPGQSGTLLEALLLWWVCSRSMHLGKEADCFIAFANGLTIDCWERISDKLTGCLVSTKSFSKYLNLLSLFKHFPNVTPRKRFQTGRLTPCWPASTSGYFCINFSCLSFIKQIGTILVFVITKGYYSIIKYIKQLPSGAKGCPLVRQRWLRLKASSLFSLISDWGKSAGQTGITVNDLQQQKSWVNAQEAIPDSVTDLELVPWLLYTSSYLLQCLTL